MTFLCESDQRLADCVELGREDRDVPAEVQRTALGVASNGGDDRARACSPKREAETTGAFPLGDEHRLAIGWQGGRRSMNANDGTFGALIACSDKWRACYRVGIGPRQKGYREIVAGTPRGRSEQEAVHPAAQADPVRSALDVQARRAPHGRRRARTRSGLAPLSLSHARRVLPSRPRSPSAPLLLRPSQPFYASEMRGFQARPVFRSRATLRPHWLFVGSFIATPSPGQRRAARPQTSRAAL